MSLSFYRKKCIKIIISFYAALKKAIQNWNVMRASTLPFKTLGFVRFFFILFILCSPRLHLFFDQITGMQSWIFSIITPVFSVARSFRNHSDLLLKKHFLLLFRTVVLLMLNETFERVQHTVSQTLSIVGYNIPCSTFCILLIRLVK